MRHLHIGPTQTPLFPDIGGLCLNNITTLFNPSNDASLNFYFQAKDYWGDIVNSNTFRITVLPNSLPHIVEKLNNVTFYKGQIAVIILAIIYYFFPFLPLK